MSDDEFGPVVLTDDDRVDVAGSEQVDVVRRLRTDLAAMKLEVEEARVAASEANRAWRKELNRADAAENALLNVARALDMDLPTADAGGIVAQASSTARAWRDAEVARGAAQAQALDLADQRDDALHAQESAEAALAEVKRRESEAFHALCGNLTPCWPDEKPVYPHWAHVSTLVSGVVAQNVLRGEERTRLLKDLEEARAAALRDPHEEARLHRDLAKMRGLLEVVGMGVVPCPAFIYGEDGVYFLTVTKAWRSAAEKAVFKDIVPMKTRFNGVVAALAAAHDALVAKGLLEVPR